MSHWERCDLCDIGDFMPTRKIQKNKDLGACHAAAPFFKGGKELHEVKKKEEKRKK